MVMGVDTPGSITSEMMKHGVRAELPVTSGIESLGDYRPRRKEETL